MKAYLAISMILALMSMMFYMTSKKMKTNTNKSTVFECGYTSHQYSRFSFSVHYYIIGLIFLFLDLELCMMMPMMTEIEQSLKMKTTLIIFVTTLLMALLTDWKEEKLEWKN